MIALLVALLLGMPLCATEDSSQCVWAAGLQGNGTGSSFVDYDGTVIPIP